MTRYRLRPHVREVTPEGLWIAALPQGPILQIGASGELVLAALGAGPAGEDPDAPSPGRTVREVVAVLEDEVPDLPGEAAEEVAVFFGELESAGVLERVRG